MNHEEMTGNEIMEKYQEVTKSYHYEGDSGVEHLNDLVKDIGYKGHGFRYGTPLEAFLSDNPGAMGAIIEWITIQLDKGGEWAENLLDVIGEDDEEETSTSEDDDEDEEE